MIKLESYSFYAAIITAGIAVLLSIVQIIISRMNSDPVNKKINRDIRKRDLIIFRIVPYIFTGLSLFFITSSIISRSILTGYGPFSNMYEFSVAFTWGILVMTLSFSIKYRSIAINTAGTFLVIILLLFASTLSSRISPLVPALQQSFLLTVHVASAVVAYGAFTIGFVTAIFYILQREDKIKWLPSSVLLEKISYTTVLIGFPFMTLVIVLGAVWADIAWGRYWAWDPKETASLLTWLIYAAYIHTRVVLHWKGKKAALLLIVGFVAVIFTFFGNYIFNGLHSYA